MELKKIKESFKKELIYQYDEKEIDIIFFEVIAHFAKSGIRFDAES